MEVHVKLFVGAQKEKTWSGYSILYSSSENASLSFLMKLYCAFGSRVGALWLIHMVHFSTTSAAWYVHALWSFTEPSVHGLAWSNSPKLTHVRLESVGSNCCFDACTVSGSSRSGRLVFTASYSAMSCFKYALIELRASSVVNALRRLNTASQCDHLSCFLFRLFQFPSNTVDQVILHFSWNEVLCCTQHFWFFSLCEPCFFENLQNPP